MVYDVTRRETFEALKRDWLQELETYADLDQLVLMIIGNKVDLEDRRQVTAEEGRELACSLEALFMETSAKTNVGVSAAFEELVQKILNTPHFWHKMDQRKQTAKSTIAIDKSEDENEESFCAC